MTTTIKQRTARHLIALVGTVVLVAAALPALGGQSHDRALAERLGQAEPERVSITLHTYGLSVAPKGQASLLTLRVVGPKRTLLLDQRTKGESIDWSLSGSDPDGSYRYEAFVSTTSLNGTQEGQVTPGGFEVKHGQIVRQ